MFKLKSFILAQLVQTTLWISLGTSAAPDENECYNPIRQIKAMRRLLKNSTEPVSDSSYYESLNNLIEKSKVLWEALSGINFGATSSGNEKFFRTSAMVFALRLNLTHKLHIVWYLIYIWENGILTNFFWQVGVSDPSSIAVQPGLVDQAQSTGAKQPIQKDVQQLPYQQVHRKKCVVNSHSYCQTYKCLQFMQIKLLHMK